MIGRVQLHQQLKFIILSFLFSPSLLVEQALRAWLSLPLPFPAEKGVSFQMPDVSFFLLCLRLLSAYSRERTELAVDFEEEGELRLEKEEEIVKLAVVTCTFSRDSSLSLSSFRFFPCMCSLFNLVSIITGLGS